MTAPVVALVAAAAGVVGLALYAVGDRPAIVWTGRVLVVAAIAVGLALAVRR